MNPSSHSSTRWTARVQKNSFASATVPQANSGTALLYPGKNQVRQQIVTIGKRNSADFSGATWRERRRPFEYDPRALKDLKKPDRATQREIVDYPDGRIPGASDPRDFGKGFVL